MFWGIAALVLWFHVSRWLTRLAVVLMLAVGGPQAMKKIQEGKVKGNQKTE